MFSFIMLPMHHVSHDLIYHAAHSSCCPWSHTSCFPCISKWQRWWLFNPKPMTFKPKFSKGILRAWIWYLNIYESLTTTWNDTNKSAQKNGEIIMIIIIVTMNTTITMIMIMVMIMRMRMVMIKITIIIINMELSMVIK